MVTHLFIIDREPDGVVESLNYLLKPLISIVSIHDFFDWFWFECDLQRSSSFDKWVLLLSESSYRNTTKEIGNAYVREKLKILNLLIKSYFQLFFFRH